LARFLRKLATFLKKSYSVEIMGTKAAELAILLNNKKIYYVNIEQPDDQDSTIENTIEDPQGILFSVERDTITFKGNGKTASFTILEKAQIIDNWTPDAEIVSTFAENGGLQIQIAKNSK